MALRADVSSRDAAGLGFGGLLGSKSSISRLWVSEGLRRIEALRGRELSGETFFCLMLDGIKLAADLTAIAAMEITNDGRKLMIDFEMGSTEDKEACDALLNRLIRRGFKTIKGTRLLCVTDGSKPLKSSVFHKERNIALHVIGAPSTLNMSLLSTNCIENSFKNVRRKIGRVSRWMPETDQAERWMAYALTEAEKGFRRIKGWMDIPLLIKALAA